MTSTKLPNRGKGLPEMMDAVDKADGAKLRIASGWGEIMYSEGKVERTAHTTHLGGTLIEWAIPSTEVKNNDGDRHDGAIDSERILSNAIGPISLAWPEDG